MSATLTKEGKLVPDPQNPADLVAERADRMLLAGTLLCGSIILAPVGLFVLGWGFIRLRAARQLGWARPLAVSLIAVFAMVDGGVNWLDGP